MVIWCPRIQIKKTIQLGYGIINHNILSDQAQRPVKVATHLCLKFSKSVFPQPIELKKGFQKIKAFYLSKTNQQDKNRSFSRTMIYTKQESNLSLYIYIWEMK